jgi:CheY-like chemotaxis protein/nitrogen-specific signal transduction histidine kinase
MPKSKPRKPGAARRPSPKAELLRALEAQSRMTADLARLKEEAEAASRAKSAFLANMSHEIRTPLNAILGMAELLEASQLNPSQRRHVAVLRNAGDALIRLIGDILDLAKVEAAKLELESAPFDVRTLVEDAADVIAVGASRKGLYVTLDVDAAVPRTLVGDAHRLRQVLLNLLGNAMKFTERGGLSIEVAFESMVDGLARVHVSVQDTGIGIPHEKAGNLFQPFSQVDASAARVHGGTGLGLSLCDRLVRLMGGRIWFESEPGLGATFHFTVALPVDAQKVEPAAGPRLGEGRRALIVQDHARERSVLRRRLERLGFTVREAEGGGVGIAAIVESAREQRPFDALLIDARMPTIDGFGVVETIQEIAGMAARTILLLSADHKDDDLERANRLRVTQTLTKPIGEAKLHAALEETLLGRRPVAEAKTATVDADRAARLAGSVLLADDSEDNRFVVLEFLKETRLAIECAENGEVAVAKCATGRFDVILLDMHMPVMDGYAAARAIRSLEEVRGRPRVPILAFSADALQEDRDRSLAAGCDDHLSKPVSRIALFEALERHLAIGPSAARAAESFVIEAEAVVDPGMKELAPGYLERRSADLPRLREMSTLRDWEGLAAAGHKLKGSGATYGFPLLSRIGARLEAAAKTANGADVEAVLRELETRVREFRGAPVSS